MDFSYSERTKTTVEKVSKFVENRILPREQDIAEELKTTRWVRSTVMESLKDEARQEGLWNLFLQDAEYGKGLSCLEYAPVCEAMGRSPIAPEVFNCSAPDTGNMELLMDAANEAQKSEYLRPLLEGKIRSCFAMTEPEVASSDAANLAMSVTKEGNEYVLNGRKWWSTGAMHPDCKFALVVGRTTPSAPKYQQHSILIVPMNAEGLRIVRPLTVFGYDDAPHGHAELEFQDVRIPVNHLVGEEGRGFQIAQGRLGPGRIHHCMRLIGLAERALELLCTRVTSRQAFGSTLADKGVIRQWIATARIEIEQARLLTLYTADRIDRGGAKTAKKEIAMIKVVAPNVALRVIDHAIQAFGAAGLSEDWPLAEFYAQARTLRFADGPDEVHQESIAKLELRPYQMIAEGR